MQGVLRKRQMKRAAVDDVKTLRQNDGQLMGRELLDAQVFGSRDGAADQLRWGPNPFA